MPTRRKTAREKRGDLIFATEDPYRNIVRLERDTWEVHILPRHDDLPSGTTGETVRNLIKEPDRIRVSTTDDDVLAFENSTIRALVLYESTDYRSGNTFGRVTTVYPPDESRHPNVGETIWESKVTGTNP
jgi:hypothetical protein